MKQVMVLLCGLGLLALAGLQLRPEPALEPMNVSLDPYDQPILAAYKLFRDALLEDNLAQLEALAVADDHFLAYRSALTLARLPAVEAATQAGYFRRALDLRVQDPLAKAEERALTLELADALERAAKTPEAILAYRDALPENQAVQGLKRLEQNPYRLANAFLQARQYHNALEALGSLSAPSIEAPAYRRTGDYALALDAYERWLAEDPGNFSARYGRALMHYYLGDLELADGLFSQLGPDPDALAFRGRIAYRQGEVDEAVRYLRQSGEPRHLWLASGYLEAQSRYSDVIAIYLELAQLPSSYQDDAAYRAYVLATRLQRPELAARAKAGLPANSFFAFKAGEALALEREPAGSEAQPPALDLAAALMQVNDQEAAVGELLFALRKAKDEASIIALAEYLQQLGEYRQSQRAAQDLLEAGSRDSRLWTLSYPRAYPLLVGQEALQTQLEPELIWAIMRQESAFYPQARSVSNAQGLMQVIPSTWDWLAELQKETPQDPFDPAANIRYGAYYLRWLLNYLEDDYELVVSAYNRGQGYIKRLYNGPVVGGDKNELYREIDAFETREYLQRVIVNYEIYKLLYSSEESFASLP